MTAVYGYRKVTSSLISGHPMKALVYTLLLIISTHVLVLDAVHHEHDDRVSMEQVQQDLASADVLDKGGDHCCQCHGFMASTDSEPLRLAPPSAGQMALRPFLPDAPADNPFRPPIA
ncbi:hypothetical protein [Alcanivorax sp.]|uniref:hypothetical protein n=2 Tax=Alcanivorax sp. TaxID=1872427 RepID=UPI003A95039F